MICIGCSQWNEISDLWSIGCILLELYTGELFFPTHHNYEHLAMMQKAFGTFPRWMAHSSQPEFNKWFNHPNSYNVLYIYIYIFFRAKQN